MYQDYKDLLSAFHAHGVRYLIVGAMRLSFTPSRALRKTLTCSSKAIPRMPKRLMTRSPNSVLRSKAFARKTQ